VPASAGAPVTLPPLPLGVQGRFIVDAGGGRYKVAGVAWYGAEQAAHVVAGLDLQRLATIVALIRQAGFNSVRLPWSDDLVENNNRYAVGCAAVAANPQLAGRHPLDVFDAVVAELTRQGLLVILDNHVSDSQWCCPADDNALWHNRRWSEAQWLTHWSSMVARYRSNPGVVGADLRNEPRFGPTGIAAWPSADPGTDWPSAAERAARAIDRAGGDHLLVIVEGITLASDLTGVVRRPLDIPANRLVYSAHDYEFSPLRAYDPSNPKVLDANLDRSWGFLLNGFTDAAGGVHGPAPVWVGEFGCNAPSLPGIPLRADDCQPDARGIGGAWYAQLHDYLKAHDLDWAYWPLNGTYAAGPVAGLSCPPKPDAGLDPRGPQAACWGMPEHYGVLTPDWSQIKPDLDRSLRELMG
jgi:endoglucanase